MLLVDSENSCLTRFSRRVNAHYLCYRACDSINSTHLISYHGQFETNTIQRRSIFNQYILASYRPSNLMISPLSYTLGRRMTCVCFYFTKYKYNTFAEILFLQPYETHLKTVSEHLEENEHEPEVLLAIGLSPLPPDASEESFFKHGFEYVDGHSSVAVQSISESLGE